MKHRVMKVEVTVAPNFESNTEMMNSFLFIEAEHPYLNLEIHDTTRFFVIVERTSKLIVIRFNLLLHVVLNISFYIIKDEQTDVAIPRKASVRLTHIYKEYHNGIASINVTSSTINPPIINNGNVQGFYLLQPGTGLCIELQGDGFSFGFRCSKFRVFNHMLIHEQGKCVAVNYHSQYHVENGKPDIANKKCTRKLDVFHKDNLAHENVNKNLYRIFHGDKYVDENDTLVSNPKYELTRINGNFGWINNKKSTDSGVFQGKVSSYVDMDNEKHHFSLRYKSESVALPWLPSVSGSIQRISDSLILLKMFSKRLFQIAIFNETIVSLDNYNNTVFCKLRKSKKLCTTNSKNFEHNPNGKIFRLEERNRKLLYENTNEKLSYFKLENKLANTVIYLTRHIDCRQEVGKNYKTALESCKAIKDYCKSATSGYYYIGGTSMVINQVYCEMETDGGGWMRLLHAFIPMTPPWAIVSDNLRTDNITEWFKSNNTKFLSSPNGLQNLRSYVKFNEIRFYCRTDSPGFVTHFKTLPNELGFKALKYFSDSSATTLPFLCKSFHAFDDDSTSMGRNCKHIGATTDGVNGHWSISSEITKDRRLYENTYMWFKKASWGVATIRCYTHSAMKNAKIQNGTFEISVR